MELPEDIRDFISNTEWTFAKTYPDWPHSYIVREHVDDRMFVKMARHLNQHGIMGNFYRTRMTYFNYDGHEYWNMDNIINRCAEDQTYDKRKAAGTLPKGGR